MEDITSLSMLGVYFLLTLTLIFLFVLATRLHNLRSKMFEMEGMMRQIRALKKRIKHLEKVLTLK